MRGEQRDDSERDEQARVVVRPTARGEAPGGRPVDGAGQPR
jgi:hypothetical protein